MQIFEFIASVMNKDDHHLRHHLRRQLVPFRNKTSRWELRKQKRVAEATHLYSAKIDIASYQEARNFLSSSDSCLPIFLSKSQGTISRPMFKKLKPMFKKLEISPKDLDKPLFN